MSSSRIACIAVSLAALAACGDSYSAGHDAETGADAIATDATVDANVSADASVCGEAPAAPELIPECRWWACAALGPPDCWYCALAVDPTQDGSPCAATDDATGLCLDGDCLVVPAVDPADQGPHQMASGSDTFTTTEDDEVPLTLYVPFGPGPYPAVVLTPGAAFGPELYASYGAHLASWGFIVVVPDLPGSLISPRTDLQLMEVLREVVDWLETAEAAPTGLLAGKVDLTRVALAGHALGGKLSVYVATQDPRPAAVFGIDPVDPSGGTWGNDDTNYPSVTPELMSLLTVPLGLVGETVNAQNVGLSRACAPEANNFHQFFVAAPGPALEIEVLGANHVSFLDDPECGWDCNLCSDGSDDPAVTRQLTRRYLASFLLVVLNDDPSYRHFLTGAGMQADVDAGLVTTDVTGAF
jgi:pimeloyl-ACP methyl ester carboxylesterase